MLGVKRLWPAAKRRDHRLARPGAVTDLTGVIAIGAGVSHTCALLSTGTVECWGWNNNGELGNGTTTDSLVPANIIGL